MKEDLHRHQNVWIAVAHQPRHATHHHYLKRAHESRESNISGTSHSNPRQSWPSLESVSTDRQPLLRSESNSSPPSRRFSDKYGRCLEILHYGTNSTIRLHQSRLSTPGSSPKLFAIKVYRHNILYSSQRLSHAQSCSFPHLADAHPRHCNILPISDLLYNERSELCLVMPYCTGGDLHELLCHTGPLPTVEADCLVTQILRALAFLHKNNTAHRDVRLETVLLTEHGAVKLAGFGDGHVRQVWAESAMPGEAEEDESSLSQFTPSQPPTWWSLAFLWISSCLSCPVSRRRGFGQVSGCSASFPGINLPYIPPEGFHRRSSYISEQQSNPSLHQENQDPRPADVWATAITYLVLVTGHLPWRSARPGDEDTRYLDYLHDRHKEEGYPQIEVLGEKRRNAIYAMLDPNPHRRITTSQMLRSEWISGVSMCEAGRKGY